MDLELKRDFHCLIFACLAERFSTCIEIRLCLPKINPFFHAGFSFKVEKVIFSLFQSKRMSVVLGKKKSHKESGL